MVKLLSFPTAIFACAFGFHSVLSAPANAEPPAGFTITSFGLNGSGCPPKSAYYLLSPDKTSVNVTYSQYFAEVGPSIDISDNRKNCQLTFGVRVPPGFTFGIASTTSRGFYFLDPGVTAAQQSLYYFQGSINQVTAKNNLAGPVPGAFYDFTAPFKVVSTNMSPCGTSTVLNVNTEIRTSNDNNPNGVGFIANESTDFSFSQIFNFVWQTCS
ncbi:hypothetical protein GALMADRAFT_137851 [Galerina marginata CBS 339.88]|uniref:Ubiquitin 3 binding protein But2 C-terminal domain-containing protein n=1 Tax=Galerina marginata (strain CBS 339.88) TaxID=685588 RepID=A0A067T6V8_GALM3|nr:hypothetical protein GALMADRAFT_137851 [Galerina marginata CBS 339.88]